MTEIWKEVEGYANYYVSNLGNVKSLKCGNIRNLKPSLNSSNYLIVGLSQNGIQKTKQIHQLVAIAFLKHNPCGHKLVVNHINFIRTDNRVKNL